MSYTPHTWAVGDVITAARLNALEQAVGNAEVSYDAVIKADSYDFKHADYTLESGSLSAVIDKIQNEEPVKIFIYGTETIGGIDDGGGGGEDDGGQVKSGGLTKGATKSGGNSYSFVVQTDLVTVITDGSAVMLYVLYMGDGSPATLFLWWTSEGIFTEGSDFDDPGIQAE